MATRVGVLGLGVIGKPIAERLVRSGFEVAVFDVRDEPLVQLGRAGASACASPAQVALGSEVVISVVSDTPQTRDVVFGELRQILKEAIADSAVLRLWDDLSPRCKGMLAATPPGATPPNLRKDLHLVLEYARELGVNLYLGTQASLVADSGIATDRDDPRL